MSRESDWYRMFGSGEAKWYSMEGGRWGVLGPAALVKEGSRVPVRYRDGRVAQTTILHVVWTDGAVSLGAVYRYGSRNQ